MVLRRQLLEAISLDCVPPPGGARQLVDFCNSRRRERMAMQPAVGIRISEGTGRRRYTFNKLCLRNIAPDSHPISDANESGEFALV